MDALSHTLLVLTKHRYQLLARTAQSSGVRRCNECACFALLTTSIFNTTGHEHTRHETCPKLRRWGSHACGTVHAYVSRGVTVVLGSNTPLATRPRGSAKAACEER